MGGGRCRIQAGRGEMQDPSRPNEAKAMMWHFLRIGKRKEGEYHKNVSKNVHHHQMKIIKLILIPNIDHST